MKIEFLDDAWDAEERALQELQGYVISIDGVDVKLFDVVSDADHNFSLLYRVWSEEAEEPVGRLFTRPIMDINELRVY